MPTSANGQLEFLKLKVFLYKYTPPFTQVANSTTTEFSTIDKFTIELDESKYFRKYDISKFVSSYNFEQDLYGITFNWSVTLSDPILTANELETDLKADVDNPPLLNDKLVSVGRNQTPTFLTTAGLDSLSQYELGSSSKTLDDSSAMAPIDIVKDAKLDRGHAERWTNEDSLVNKIEDVPVVAGLRLSDIIQPYDLISVFLYKETTPLEELKGFKTLFVKQPIEAFHFVVDPAGTEKLTAKDLQKETILLSPTVPGRTLFSNEFNGFVISKAVTRAIGGLDTVTINGNGTSRLLGATRRVIKPSLFTNIYDIAETRNILDVVPFQNVFAGSPIEFIVTNLFRFIYSTGFDISVTTDPTTGNLGNTDTLSGSTQIITSLAINKSFFDISLLQVGNLRQVNVFSIPPFLLALAMKRRLFNFREASSTADLNALSETIDIKAADATAIGNSAENQTVDQVLNETTNLQTSYLNGSNPVEFDKELLGLRTYFRFFQDVFTAFTPETKTPLEILEEVKSKTFAEIFEHPNGTMFVRNPKYNSVSNVIFSSDLDVVNASYSETVDNLVSRIELGYMIDPGIQLLDGQAYGFTDGKLLLQYGFAISSTDANPNAKDDVPSDNQIVLDRNRLIFRYAEFFLRLHNASLKTGVITINLDPRITVGMTIFDEKNQKFSYITGVTKNVAVGQTATMTLQLRYVRDAIDTLPGEKNGTALRFEKLLTLAEIDKS